MSPKVLVFDFEVESHNKGNPFDPRNHPICFAYFFVGDQPDCIEIDKEFIATKIGQADFLLGFNVKFDIHWLRRLGISISPDQQILDAQQAEFLISNQKQAYPSLEECAQKYLNQSKIDIIKQEYWDKGKLTSEVPKDLLFEYAKKDVELTYNVFQKQLQILRKENKMKLFTIIMQDLLILQEMEWNGLRFNEDKAKQLAEESKKRIVEIDFDLFGEHEHKAIINPDSGDHLSCFLYGGTIPFETRVPNGVYKSGEKIGLPRYKKLKYEIQFKRQFEPPDGSELKKPGFFSTDEKVLRKLKGKEAKRVVNLLLERSELAKLISTYYEGLIKQREKFHWEKDELHGQLNQVVARTGRLSASEPNQQNMAGKVKDLFYSRY